MAITLWAWPELNIDDTSAEGCHVGNLASARSVAVMHFLSAALGRRKQPGVTQPETIWESSPMPQQLEQKQRQTLNTIPIELQERIIIAVRRSLLRSLASLPEHLFRTLVYARP
jgi:hypothetical protein